MGLFGRSAGLEAAHQELREANARHSAANHDEWHDASSDIGLERRQNSSTSATPRRQLHLDVSRASTYGYSYVGLIGLTII